MLRVRRGRAVRRACLVVAMVLFTGSGCAGSGERALGEGMSPEARTYLREALSFMEQSSLRREQIDWPALRSTAFKQAGAAQTAAETYRAIAGAVGALGDGHSWFRSPEETDEDLGASVSQFHGLKGRRLLGGMGYISLPGVLGDDETLAAYVEQGQASVTAADGGRACGWIVDLRRNSGGNMWPMLTVVASILGDGPVGAYVRNDGTKIAWTIKDRAPRLDGQKFPWEPLSPVARKNPAVAVLTSRQTASSGEAIRLAFRGRPSTRSFGQPTFGVPTNIAIQRLSDGATIGVTDAQGADRTGRTYDGPVTPDEAVPDQRQGFGTKTDQAVNAATAWLADQPCCDGT